MIPTANIPAFAWASVASNTMTPNTVATAPQYCECAVNTLKGKPVHHGIDTPNLLPLYTPFFPIASYMLKLRIDPFAGWGERHFAYKKHNKQYIGYDTSNEGDLWNLSILDAVDLKQLN